MMVDYRATIGSLEERALETRSDILMSEEQIVFMLIWYNIMIVVMVWLKVWINFGW